MTPKTSHCLDESRSVKKQAIILVLVLGLCISLTFVTYMLIKPQIEKVYTLEFNSNVNVTSFTVNGYNYTSGQYENMTLHAIDLGILYDITAINFKLHNWKQDYSTEEYRFAYEFNNASSELLNNNMKNGKYIERIFALHITTLFELKAFTVKFKMPQEYRIFNIGLIMQSKMTNFSFSVEYGLFFTTSDMDLSNYNELHFTINSIIWDSMYILLASYEKMYYSLYTFDFTFR